MDETNIYIPSYVSIDIASFEFFAGLYAELSSSFASQININFQNCSYFEGNMFAVLGSILEDLKLRRNKIFLTKTSPTVREIIYQNGFSSKFGYEIINVSGDSPAIQYKKFEISESKLIKEYLENQLFSKPNMPFISAQLQIEIIKSIFEIYANALTHGESEFVFSCGQLVRKNALNFTFVDLGQTIKNKVVEFLKKPMKGSEAISWATSDKNTTKTGNHSGGFGLKLIQQFLDLNQGKLQIVSGEGYWEKNNDSIVTADMQSSFPGTIVNLVFNLSDTNSYYLTSELTEVNNIF